MPDYETRLAILRKENSNEIYFNRWWYSFINCYKIDSNIRELEGVLNKILARASLTHSPITIEVVEKAINDVTLQKKILFLQTTKTVANYFKIDKKTWYQQKSNDIAYPRQITSFPRIGNDFGKRSYNGNACFQK